MARKRARRESGEKTLKRQAGAAALVTALLAGAVPTAARAGDVWTCTWPGFTDDHRPVVARFKVQGDYLVEDDPLQGSYRILQNNENALIATLGSAAIPPGREKLTILSRTFLIDKSTGELVWANLALGDPNAVNKPVRGTCRLSRER